MARRTMLELEEGIQDLAGRPGKAAEAEVGLQVEIEGANEGTMGLRSDTGRWQSGQTLLKRTHKS